MLMSLKQTFISFCSPSMAGSLNLLRTFQEKCTDSLNWTRSDNVSLLDVAIHISQSALPVGSRLPATAKFLKDLNRRQPLKLADESQCGYNWMQSTHALPSTTTTPSHADELLNGPLIRKSHINSCQGRPGNDGSPCCPISSLQEAEKKQLHLLLTSRGRSDGNAAQKSQAASAVFFRQNDPASVPSNGLTEIFRKRNKIYF